MGVEDNTKAFLMLIVKTISITLTWMVINVFFGLYMGFGFFEGVPGWKNYLYYLFLVVSLYFLIRYIRRKWML